MKVTSSHDDWQLDVYIEKTTESVYITVILTNSGSSEKTFMTGPKWADIQIVDENGLCRLPSVGSTMNTFSVTLQSGQSLFERRKTQTLQQAEDENLEYVKTTTDTDVNQEDDSAMFVSHMDLATESDNIFTAKLRIPPIDGLSDVSIDFQPEALEQVTDRENEYDVVSASQF